MRGRRAFCRHVARAGAERDRLGRRRFGSGHVCGWHFLRRRFYGRDFGNRHVDNGNDVDIGAAKHNAGPSNHAGQQFGSDDQAQRARQWRELHSHSRRREERARAQRHRWRDQTAQQLHAKHADDPDGNLESTGRMTEPRLPASRFLLAA
jgi:hypothetical protein